MFDTLLAGGARAYASTMLALAIGAAPRVAMRQTFARAGTPKRAKCRLNLESRRLRALSGAKGLRP